MLDPRAPRRPAGLGTGVLWVFFGLRGRVGRQVYWLSFLLLIALNSVMVSQIFGGPDASMSRFAETAFPLVALVTMYANIAGTTKRLHDMGMNGLFSLALLIPLVNIGVTIWAGIVPGNPGPNRYGKTADAPA